MAYGWVPQIYLKTFTYSIFGSKVLTEGYVSVLIHLTGNKILEISTSFEDEGRFPGVIDLIDGTPIRIRAPENEPEAYINRKKFHSLNVQVELKKCLSLNEPTLLLPTL